MGGHNMDAFILFFSLAVLLIIGVPIGISLGVSTLISFLLMGIPIPGLAQRIFTALDSFAIMAIPFFVLAGNIMVFGGISRRLVVFSNSIIGNIKGGMSFAVVIACAFFAALSGSGPATVVAIGSMLYPEMVKIGYPKGRSAGLITVAGGLGPIIPPSIIMVVFGTITEASISQLFTVGAFWGIIITIVLLVQCLVIAHKEDWPKNETKLTFKEIIKSFFEALPALFLPVIILGGIYSGIFTPTEAAGVAVVYSLVVSLFVYKEIKVSDLSEIFLESAKGSAAIMFIIATSSAFAWYFTFSGISTAIVETILAANLSKITFLALVSFILLVFGFFLEGIATVLLLVPVLYPIAVSLGIHPIHFGIIATVSNVIGCMTPPVAVNIFSAASFSKLSIEEIVEGELPFFIALVLIFGVIVFVPEFTLFWVS